MAKETFQNEIKTLNGEVIGWPFFNKDSKFVRHYDVVDDSYKNMQV